jgi:cytoskeletal protein RodZ
MDQRFASKPTSVTQRPARKNPLPFLITLLACLAAVLLAALLWPAPRTPQVAEGQKAADLPVASPPEPLKTAPVKPATTGPAAKTPETIASPSSKIAVPQEGPFEKTPAAKTEETAPAGPTKPEGPEKPPDERATTPPDEEPEKPTTGPEKPESGTEAQPDAEPPAAPAKTDGRLPIPDRAAIGKADRILRDTYKDELSKSRTTAQKAEMAKKFLSQADQVHDDPAGRYACLELARGMALEGNDVPTAFEAIDRMGKDYAVDPMAAKTDLVAECAKSARNVGQHAQAAKQALALMDQASAAKQFDAAARLGKLAQSEAAKSRDTELIQQVRTRLKETQQAWKENKRIEQARATLKEQPDDPEANLVIGRIECLMNGNWAAGLPHLAKCSEEKLRDLAKKDLAGPTTTDGQIEMADGWWDRAAAEPAFAHKQLKLRAASWYRKAEPNVKGILKAKVEKRLEQAPAAE